MSFLKLLQIFIISLGLTACANQKPPAYVYLPNSDNIEGNGIIVARVSYYGQKPEENKSNENFVDSFVSSTNGLIDKMNHKIIQTFHEVDGKVLYGAQVVLTGSNNDQESYYLGKAFYPTKSDISLFYVPHSIKINVGNKGAFEIYYGMPAYSVLTIPAGVYKITGRGYFDSQNHSYEISRKYSYKSHAIKSFYIKPNEVVYIGDINVGFDNIEIRNNSAEAQGYMNGAYPKIADKLIYRLIQ